MSDVEETNAQQSKTSGVRKTHILPAPTMGGTSKSLEEALDKRKRGGRGLKKRAKTEVVEL